MKHLNIAISVFVPKFTTAKWHIVLTVFREQLSQVTKLNKHCFIDLLFLR